jgi:hypothetical protein
MVTVYHLNLGDDRLELRVSPVRFVSPHLPICLRN